MKVNQGMQILNSSRGFPVAEGVTLYASTFPDLYGMIASYRMQHGIDPGDPERDVNRYFCTSWPNFCQAEATDGPTEVEAAKGMGRRVAAWSAIIAREQPQGGYELVDDTVASSRANICTVCPFNKAWETNCAPCWSAVNSVLAQVRRLRNVQLSIPVWGCWVDGSENRTAALLPSDVIKAKMVDPMRYAPACWKPLL